MTQYTYTVGEFLAIESDIEVFLFDTAPQKPVSQPDIRLRETDSERYSVEWTDGRVEIALPPRFVVEKLGSTEPTPFTRLLLSAVQAMLLRQGATLLFGAALQTPRGDGLGLFGPSDCGKSVASFRLARNRQYRLLADDLLVCHDGRVHPFPRYMNLPRDVPDVERWVQSAAVPETQVRRFSDEIDVPRRLVTDSVPEQVELDDILLIPPGSTVERTGRRATHVVSTGRAETVLAALQESALANWVSHSAVRETVPDRGADMQAIVGEALADTTCHETASGRLTASVASLRG